MRVISSQRFLDEDVLGEKMRELQQMLDDGEQTVTLPVWDSEITDDDGQTLYVLADGHHRLAAAQELGMKVEYAVHDHPEKLTGETLLDVCWMDTDWYDVTTGHEVW